MALNINGLFDGFKIVLSLHQLVEMAIWWRSLGNGFDGAHIIGIIIIVATSPGSAG